MDNKLSLVVQFEAVDRLTGSLRAITASGRTGSAALRALQADARGTRRELTEVGRSLETASGNVTQLMNRERALRAELARTNREMEQRKALLRIDARADALAQRGSDMQARGTEQIIAGGALAAPIVLAARAGADYTTTLVDIQQKSNMSNEATDRLGRNMLRIARDARMMPAQVASGVDVLTGMGLDPERAEAMIPAIARASTAVRGDMGELSQTAFANMQNLNVAARDTGRALDIMAAGANQGAFETRDMSRHFPGLTAQMQGLGEGGLTAVGSLTAALQMARRATGTSDEAGNNIQNLLAKINSPATIRAFERNFGVNLPEAMARLRAQGMDTFEAIATVTRDATGGDLSKLGFAFEDMQAQGAIRALIQNLDDYRATRDAAMRGEGTIDRAFDQRVLRDANVSWQAFMGSVSTLAITLGTTLLPTLTEVANYLGAGLQWISAWAQANPEAARAIMQGVGALAAFKIGIGAVMVGVGSLLGPFATMWRLFAKARQIGFASQALGRFVNIAIRSGSILTRTFMILRTAALFMAQGIVRAGALMLANPMVLAITLIVVALAGAAYLVYRNWDRIKAGFSMGLSYLSTAWNWLKANVGNILIALTGPLGIAAALVFRNWGRIRAAFSGALAWIGGLVGRFATIGRQIIDGLVAGISAAPGRVWNALRSIVMRGVDGVRRFLGIASPSRLFIAIGGHVSQGLALGIDRGRGAPIAAARGLATSLAGAAAFTAPAIAAASPFASSSPSASAMAPVAQTVSITINAAPGQDPRAIAEEVRRILNESAARAQRSSYEDR